MPKKDRVNKKQAKGKRLGKKQGAVLHKKRLTAASAAQQEKAVPLNKQETDVGAALSKAVTSLASPSESLKRDGKQAQQSPAVEAVAKRSEELAPSKRTEQVHNKHNAQSQSKRSEQAIIDHSEQLSGKRVEQRASSKPSNYSEEHYRKLYHACEKSKHLAGRLTQQRAGLQLTLPASLPSSLIFRALNKDANRYKELSLKRIAAIEEQTAQLELNVDGMRKDQMTTLIEELDALIGEFTGRS